MLESGVQNKNRKSNDSRAIAQSNKDSNRQLTAANVKKNVIATSNRNLAQNITSSVQRRYDPFTSKQNENSIENSNYMPMPSKELPKNIMSSSNNNQISLNQLLNSQRSPGTLESNTIFALGSARPQSAQQQQNIRQQNAVISSNDIHENNSSLLSQQHAVQNPQIDQFSTGNGSNGIGNGVGANLYQSNIIATNGNIFSSIENQSLNANFPMQSINYPVKETLFLARGMPHQGKITVGNLNQKIGAPAPVSSSENSISNNQQIMMQTHGSLNYNQTTSNKFSQSPMPKKGLKGGALTGNNENHNQIRINPPQQKNNQPKAKRVLVLHQQQFPPTQVPFPANINNSNFISNYSTTGASSALSINASTLHILPIHTQFTSPTAATTVSIAPEQGSFQNLVFYSNNSQNSINSPNVKSGKHLNGGVNGKYSAKQEVLNQGYNFNGFQSGGSNISNNNINNSTDFLKNFGDQNFNQSLTNFNQSNINLNNSTTSNNTSKLLLSNQSALIASNSNTGILNSYSLLSQTANASSSTSISRIGKIIMTSSNSNKSISSNNGNQNFEEDINSFKKGSSIAIKNDNFQDRVYDRKPNFTPEIKRATLKDTVYRDDIEEDTPVYKIKQIDEIDEDGDENLCNQSDGDINQISNKNDVKSKKEDSKRGGIQQKYAKNNTRGINLVKKNKNNGNLNNVSNCEENENDQQKAALKNINQQRMSVVVKTQNQNINKLNTSAQKAGSGGSSNNNNNGQLTTINTQKASNSNSTDEFKGNHVNTVKKLRSENSNQNSNNPPQEEEQAGNIPSATNNINNSQFNFVQNIKISDNNSMLIGSQFFAKSPENANDVVIEEEVKNLENSIENDSIEQKTMLRSPSIGTVNVGGSPPPATSPQKQKAKPKKQQVIPPKEILCLFDNYNDYNKPYRDYLLQHKAYKVKIQQKYKGMHLHQHEVPSLYWPQHGTDWPDFMKAEQIMKGLIRNISNFDHKDKFEMLLRNSKFDFPMQIADFIPQTLIIDYSNKMYLDDEVVLLGLKEDEQQIYIQKTAQGLLGDGIKIIGNIAQFKKEFRAKKLSGELATSSPVRVVQQYVMDPLTIQGRKCDFRVFFTVVCTEKNWIFLYHPGYLRFSLVKYSTDSDEKDVHTTHFAGYLEKMKNSPEYSKLLQQTRCSHTWFNDQFQSEYNQTDDDIKEIYKKIKKVMTYSFLTGTMTDTIKRVKGHFHTFGCDVLLDSKCNPWFIEANAIPGIDYADDDVKDPSIRTLAKNVADLVLDFYENWNDMDEWAQNNSFIKPGSAMEMCYNEANGYNICME